MEKTYKEYLEEILCSKVSDDLTGSQKQALEAVTELLGFCDYERLCELAKADKNARCVVLPCNVGDCVWVTMAYGKQFDQPVKGHIQKFVLHDDEIVYLEAIIWMDIGDGENGYGYTEKSFGKIVFLDFESAREALKG